ncbi:carbamoyl phosphate synthase large subunit [Sesbania bispinosa]|nr:carbamoyl phosphate synthase large subunit [Sesbania bispinosa]KAJ1383287.1 carbamoyl phosphate synthase large subunit [Sesbania bispinosa]KAJ1413416.1 carbamoyl phosphate synthase large subunit [Sesbania bispinosa]KAJ1420946.1 carbamoyl phosphate synthase large subunit [Sesbania bispinosa]KAJ1435981.1 carbamoyl phosphate synthase large subunit [Sesbania bispinosa]
MVDTERLKFKVEEENERTEMLHTIIRKVLFAEVNETVFLIAKGEENPFQLYVNVNRGYVHNWRKRTRTRDVLRNLKETLT